MRCLFILLSFFITTQVVAQDFGAAVIFNSEEAFDKYDKKLLNYVKKAYRGRAPIHTEYYTWDGKPSSKPKPYERFKSDKDGTVPITTALYLKTNLKIQEKLEPTYKKDTTGTVTSMYLSYPLELRPIYKVVDLPSSEVIKVHRFETKEWKIDQKYQVKDFKKYFGATPNTLQSKAFNQKMKVFKEKKGKDVEKFYNEKLKKISKDLADISNVLKATYDKRLFKVTEVNTNEKKIKEFYIDAKASENISKGDLIQVYQKDQYGDFDMYGSVGQVAYVVVQSADETRAKVKPFFLAKKKISEALKSGNEIVLARNPLLVKEANKKDETVKRIQIKGECFLCNPYLEKVLLGLASTKLMERNFDGPRSYFTSQYTDEKFMDFDMLDIQDKQEGVDYLFEVAQTGVKATDVTTGRVASIDQKKNKGLLGLFGSTGPQTINLCMDIMDKDIQVLEITKEKKGKVKKFLGYSPFGFEGITTLDIYIVHEETVGGRVIEREEHIGKCWAQRPQTEYINEIKVAKGEKDLYKALQANQKVIFKVKL